MHVNGDRVEAAYWNSDMFDRRLALMADCLTYVAKPVPYSRNGSIGGPG